MPQFLLTYIIRSAKRSKKQIKHATNLGIAVRNFYVLFSIKCFLCLVTLHQQISEIFMLATSSLLFFLPLTCLGRTTKAPHESSCPDEDFLFILVIWITFKPQQSRHLIFVRNLYMHFFFLNLLFFYCLIIVPNKQRHWNLSQ